MGHVIERDGRSHQQESLNGAKNSPIPQKSPELVMHMSKLPVFLQNVKESSVQEKALNFGVLDWKKLENWKCTAPSDGEPASSTKGAAKIDPKIPRHVSSQSWSPNSLLSGSSVHSLSECYQSSEPRKSYDRRSDEAAGSVLAHFFSSQERDKVRFSHGNKSRNSSFRESTVESGAPNLEPEAEIPPTMDRVLRDHASAGRKGRSTSLLRLLDPISKRKPAQSADMNRSPPPAKVSEQSQSKQANMSKNRALLQLTLKNELPFYKLVIDTSNSMLVAAAKKLWPSEKSNPSVAYTFYSVSEIKKKSMNWMSKGNPCSLCHSIIGQMSISQPVGSGTRECILYSDQGASFVPEHEIAAIISSRKDDDGDCNGTVVILPGGVHGAPARGSHSSLISRWKSGGSCDCGGWDVGCKLRVLSELHGSSMDLQESTTNNGFLQLFSQDEKHGRPILSMEPLNIGLYSVGFDDSVPLLEAFSICVAHLTVRNYAGIIDEFHFPDPNSGTEKIKAPETEPRVKYASCPPLSPAGRI